MTTLRISCLLVLLRRGCGDQRVDTGLFAELLTQFLKPRKWLWTDCHNVARSIVCTLDNRIGVDPRSISTSTIRRFVNVMT